MGAIFRLHCPNDNFEKYVVAGPMMSGSEFSVLQCSQCGIFYQRIVDPKWPHLVERDEIVVDSDAADDDLPEVGEGVDHCPDCSGVLNELFDDDDDERDVRIFCPQCQQTLEIALDSLAD